MDCPSDLEVHWSDDRMVVKVHTSHGDRGLTMRRLMLTPVHLRIEGPEGIELDRPIAHLGRCKIHDGDVVINYYGGQYRLYADRLSDDARVVAPECLRRDAATPGC